MYNGIIEHLFNMHTYNISSKTNNIRKEKLIKKNTEIKRKKNEDEEPVFFVIVITFIRL
jgi:hypothetical protein